MINELAIIDEATIKNKIYVIRGKQVMLDSDLALIYGYQTKDFNRQVKNNIDRFDDDFMFQLTEIEYKNLRCKFSTSSLNNTLHGGRRYLPYAFTEQGIYMLMTVLKGELAIKQSKALIRIFKKMKDYIIDMDSMIKYNNIIDLALMTKNNTDDIKVIKEELIGIHNCLEITYDKEKLIMNGEYVESDLTYKKIYSLAKKSIFIIDDYIDLKTLVLLKDVNEKIKITIFSDNVGNRLHKIEYDDFIKEYNKLCIEFKTTDKKIHDRYIILDYEEKSEKIFHCGASSKDSGNKVTSIYEIKDIVIYDKIIDSLLNNKDLILK